MAGKLGSAFFCLLFAIPFGGVGVFATWAIGATLWDAHRAQDWVRVKASVGSASLDTGSSGGTFRAEGTYRYAFQGKDYAGSRLGISKVGGSDNIDDWHQEVAARLEDARAAGRPVSVWVNPDNPSESVFDREIRWSELIFLVPFSLAFGGVGVGALIAMVFVLSGGSGTAAQDGKGALQARLDEMNARQGSKGGAGFLWVFAFFWNALSFPIAFLVVRDVAQSGEWMGLLVLLFPLVGVGVLWAAISATWNAWLARRGAGDAAPRGRAAASTPGRLTAQAGRAMFDPQGATAARLASRPSGQSEADIPPSIAEVEERGGILTLRYSRRRRLGLVVMLFVIGAILAAIGAAMFAAEGIGIAAVLMLLVGGLMDAGALSMLMGSLVVTAKAGELAVEQAGLFGRKSWRVRRDDLTAIRPTVSYSVNDYPYYAVFAEANGGTRVLLGNSLRGPELADTVARRIGRVLGVRPGIIQPANPPSAS